MSEVPATDEQYRNKRLAANLAAGRSPMPLDEVMELVRRYAAAGLDVPGPRAAQLAEEIDRLRAMEQRARNLLAINEPMTRRTALVILGELDA